MIKVCTWNLQHLSPPSRKEHREGSHALDDQRRHAEDNSIVIAALVHILESATPDVLVLQEVNDLDDPLAGEIRVAVQTRGYSFHWGPRMQTGSTVNTGQKLGKQSELYPIIFRSYLRCSEGELLVLPTSNVAPTHGMQLRKRKAATLDESEWVYHRPLVVYDINADGADILLAVIHTSPGRESTTSPAAVNAVRERARGKKWIIAGDWYLQPEEMVTIEEGPYSWAGSLPTLKARRIAPEKKTNFSHNTGAKGTGGSKVADYFVCDEAIEGDATVVPPPALLHGKTSTRVFRTRTPDAWFTAGLGDHVPVCASLTWTT